MSPTFSRRDRRSSSSSHLVVDDASPLMVSRGTSPIDCDDGDFLNESPRRRRPGTPAEEAGRAKTQGIQSGENTVFRQHRIRSGVKRQRKSRVPEREKLLAKYEELAMEDRCRMRKVKLREEGDRQRGLRNSTSWEQVDYDLGDLRELEEERRFRGIQLDFFEMTNSPIWADCEAQLSSDEEGDENRDWMCEIWTSEANRRRKEKAFRGQLTEDLQRFLHGKIENVSNLLIQNIGEGEILGQGD